MTTRAQMAARMQAAAEECDVRDTEGRLAIEHTVRYGDGTVIVYPYLTPRDQQWGEANDLHAEVVKEQREFAAWMRDETIEPGVKRAALERRREKNKLAKRADRDPVVVQQWERARDAALAAIAKAVAEGRTRREVSLCACQVADATGLTVDQVLAQREAAPEVSYEASAEEVARA